MIKKKKQITAKFIKLSSENADTDLKIQLEDKYIHQPMSNKLPYYLLELFKGSGLHRSIIERKVNMLIGTGLDKSEMSEKELNFLAQINPYESFDDVMKKCAYDVEVQGGYYLQVIWNKIGTEILEVYHMPYEKMRLDLPNKYNHIEDYLLWTDYVEEIQPYTEIQEFEQIPSFNVTKNKGTQQILFIKDYSPSNLYYGAPIYEASLLDIKTYQEISNFNNSLLTNGFAPSFLVFFRGSMPDEETQDDIMEQFQNKYTGTDNAGKKIVFFLDEEQEEPKIEPFDTSNLSEQYKTLLESIKENIVLSHQIPKQVIGMETAGALGNTKEILQSSQMFRSDYIQPHQEILLKGFNMITAVNGFKEELKIVNPTPNVLLYDMSELLTVLEKNEVRELLGYEEVEGLDEEPIIDEVKKEEDNNE